MNTTLIVIGYVLRGILWVWFGTLAILWLHKQIDRTKP